MLTIFSGQPGAGKTAAGVDLILSDYKDRLLYLLEPPDPTKGRIELKIPHVLIDNLDDCRRWHELVPDGAVVFIPEVQRVWPPRGPSQKPGPDVMALETHRHRALDLVVDTQHPRMVDPHVKSVAGRHIHIRSTGWLGRWAYEWPEISDAIAWKTCANKRRYKLPKRAFGLYKSATEHIAPKRGIPPAAYFAIIAIIATVALVWSAVRTFQRHTAPPAAAGAASTPHQPGQEPLSVGRGVSSTITAATLQSSFVPRVYVEPNTAPAYDHLRQVVVMPRIVGGYCIGQACKCITQQNTDAGIGSAACRDWLRNPPFDPYRQERTTRTDGQVDAPSSGQAGADAAAPGQSKIL